MKDMLRYNFYLSKWFAGMKQDKVISGTSFLFLNQVSFLFLAAFLIAIKFLPYKLSPKIVVCAGMVVISFIMYGLQKTVQAKVRENKYDKDFNTLTTTAIYKNRLIALVLFVLPFILCFIVLILFYR